MTWLEMWDAVGFAYYRRMFGASLRGGRFISQLVGCL